MGARVGETAAGVYEAWALFLLVGGLGFHFLVFFLYLYTWGRPRLAQLRPLMEFVYGLINPAVYLLVFQPALFRRWTPAWLPWLCWIAWAAYWAARLFGAERKVGALTPRQWTRQLLRFVAVLLAALFLRDAVVVVCGPFFFPSVLEPDNAILGFTSLPLYALPFLAALKQLRATANDESWATSGFFLGPRRPAWLPIALLGALGLGAAATLPGLSETEVRALLVEHHDAIVSASRERNLDPRLLASIVFVTQRDLTSPFRSRLEDAIADAWLTDSKSHTLLAEGLDPSLGMAQVKAHTVLTAYAIRELSSPTPPKYLSKEYRSVRSLSGEALDRIPSLDLQRVARPAGGPLPSKRTVVETLRTPAGNLTYAAFLLDLVATQWEVAKPEWSIRARPDIMATLFQLGFERSVPKADPRSNDFGDRVGAAFEDEWMKAHFAD